MFMTKEYWWSVIFIISFSLTQTYGVTEWETDAEIMEYTK
jgi:hypothetical protein